MLFRYSSAALQSTIETMRDEKATAASRHREIETRLHVQLEELRTSNAALLTQLHDLAQAKITSDNLFDELKAEALAVERHIERVVVEKDRKIDEVNVQLASLQSEYQACAVAKEAEAVLVADLQTQLRVADDAHRDLLNTLAETTTTHDARVLLLTNQASDVKNELEDQLKRDRESLSALMIEHARTDACLGQSNQRVSELEGQLKDDRESLRQHEDTAARAKEELSSLRQELLDLRVASEQQADAAAAANVLAATLADKEIESLKLSLHETEITSAAANERLQTLLEKSELDFLALSMRHSDLMTTSSSAQLSSDREIRALKEELSDLQSSSSATIAEWESLCKQNAADITVSNRRVSELEGQLAETTTTNDALVSLLVDHNDTRTSQLTEQISNLQTELTATNATKTSLSIELSEQIITLQSDRDRQSREWSLQRTVLEDQVTSMSKLSEEQSAVITDLHTQLSSKQAELSDLAAQLDQLSLSKKQGEEQIHTLQQTLEIQKEELNAARVTAQMLGETHLLFETESAQTIRELKEELSSSQLSQSASLDRIATLEASIVSWKDQVEELNVRIADMTLSSQAHVDALTLTISESQQRLVDLETEHTTSTATLTSTHSMEMSQLADQLLAVRTEGIVNAITHCLRFFASL